MTDYARVFASVVAFFGDCSFGGMASYTTFPTGGPRLSGEVFLERCSEDVDPEVALCVRGIVSQQLGVEYARIFPESSFVNHLGCG